MKKEKLQQQTINTIIDKLERYDLKKYFSNEASIDIWISRLNKHQISNFNSLNIDPNLIMFPKHLLINEALLNSSDYPKKVEYMCKLKNGEGCWHLFDVLCSPKFLASKKYYQDIEQISKAPTARYGLWVIDEEAFIKSKYHNEDLKLITEAKDIKEEALDWLVAESLATVAKNNASIKSQYHQKDMHLIATSGSSCLQMSGSYPSRGLNNLAINPVSLNDKYHLENMQILAKNPISSEFLYKLMTNPRIVKGKYYREEINFLTSAKSLLKATAIYDYIANPTDLCTHEFSHELYDCGLDFIDIDLLKRNQKTNTNNHPNYLQNLNLLNQLDDKYVMYFEYLLSNKYFMNSIYRDYDLSILKTITDKDLFMDLYKIMSDENFTSSPQHLHDVYLISKTTNPSIRNLLIRKAKRIPSIESKHHEYDMEYISKLDLDTLNEQQKKQLEFYLFHPIGINHSEHIERLEKIYKKEPLPNIESVIKYEKDLSLYSNYKPTSKTKRLFKKR